jgi:hypothetical protein
MPERDAGLSRLLVTRSSAFSRCSWFTADSADSLAHLSLSISLCRSSFSCTNFSPVLCAALADALAASQAKRRMDSFLASWRSRASRRAMIATRAS